MIFKDIKKELKPGQKFNKLTIMKKNSKKTLKTGELYYYCLCDCGNKKTIYGYSIRSGNVISCGCIKSDKKYTKKLRLTSENLESSKIILNKIKKMTSNKEHNLSWCAGFFDGEGCTTITSCKGAACLRASLAQVEREPLDKFLKTVRIGTIRGPYKYGTNKQFHWQWNASGVDVINVIHELWPFLSEVKRKQAITNINQYIKYLKEKTNA